MPNHVYSCLKISYHDDNGEMIEKISQLIKNEHSSIDFNKIIPQPIGIKDEREFILSDSEYNWNKQNWGTKWNAYSVDLKVKNDTSLIITLQTAWNCPIPILEKLFELFPEVNIEYICSDDGGWFAYHIIKPENEKQKVNIWESNSENDRYVINAIFQSLNLHY
jgi:hypothetical protein